MAGSATGPMWSVVASIRRQSRAGSTFVMRRHPVDATRRGAPSCRPRRVLATGAARGMWASRLRPVERAAASMAAAGAMRSCVHPSCEVSIPGTRSPVQASIPGGHVAAVHQRRRPMSPALGRDQWQPTGDCRGHRRTSFPEFILLLYGGSNETHGTTAPPRFSQSSVESGFFWF